MTPTYNNQSGFSTVELLITLFIAAAFLTAGYMLYIAVIRDSGEAYQRAQASAVAYDYLRQYTANRPSSNCTNSTPISAQTPTNNPSGLTNLKVTVSLDCPSSITTLWRVTATATYGTNSQETVTHAAYATPQ